MRSLALIGAGCLLLSLLACSDPRARQGAQTEGAAGLRVAVTIPPHAAFAETVGGERVSVLTVVPVGADPHSFEPSPRLVAELSTVKIWFVADLEVERALVPRIAALYPELRIVDLNDGLALRPLDGEAESENGAPNAESEAGHAHEGLDPHVWLGLSGALAQAAAIRDSFLELDPEGAAVYQRNYEAFEAKARAAFAALEPHLAPLSGSPVFVYHPAFGYFLDHFGLGQVAVEAGGKEPSQRSLAALVERARSEGARAIFVQAQFPRAAAETVAKALDVPVVPLDDLAYDWLANLERLALALETARSD